VPGIVQIMLKNYPFSAVIFDLDGVITQTALVHSAVWKKMFDEFLLNWSKKNETEFQEFEHNQDYLPYIDGKPRYQGVESFLKSRNIELPYGDPSDSPEMETICGLGNRKNLTFNEVLEKEGVKVYQSTIDLIYELRKNGIHIGVASSSKNCKPVLERAGILNLFETIVDGTVSAELGLKGKPFPDIFITACKNLNVSPNKAVVVEDAVSGVEAGKNGNFGFVLGVARENNHRELLIHGADRVVSDLEELGGIKGMMDWFTNGLSTDNNSLIYYDLVPEKEKQRETLLTVGNGYFATRGSMEETLASICHYPATYMAGVYNRLVSKVAGRDVENEDFVNCINWLPVTFKIGQGEWFDLDKAEIIEIQRELDFRSGIMKRKLTVKFEGKTTRIESERFVSMHQRNIAAQKYTIKPIDYDDEITIKAGLDIDLINDGVDRYRSLNQKHILPLEEKVESNSGYLVGCTTQSNIRIACTYILDANKEGSWQPLVYKGKVFSLFTACIRSNEEVTLTKRIVLNNSLSNDDPLTLVLVEGKNLKSYEDLRELSEVAWRNIWTRVDIELEGDRLAQKIFRLHLFHLFVTASPHNASLDAGIPARGLHGEAYRGHIFWDELFILPLYNLSFPEISRSALMYRYRRLPAAREYARAHGYRGAMFPWQSGSSGREETQVVHLNPVSGEWGDDYSSIQRHVSLAIAYNIWEYYHSTLDQQFLNDYGAELFLDICMFWTGLCHKDAEDGRYHIRGVMGPDEFHEKYPNAKRGGLDDNAYSNLMTVWALQKAYQMRNIIGEECFRNVARKIGLNEQEWQRWKNIRQNLALCINEEGIIAQFDGYFELKELDWEYFKKKYGNVYRMDRLLKAEGLSPDEFKVAKQADVLMIFYNLLPEEVNRLLQEMGYDLPKDYLKKNFWYYLNRTSHGSTLSRVVHAKLAHLVGEEKLAWQLFREALISDYIDIQGGTTAEGIHAGVMAGTVWLALTVYAGLSLCEDIPSFQPDLPYDWEAMKFNFIFRGIRYYVEIDRQKIVLTAGAPHNIEVKAKVWGKEYILLPGIAKTIEI